DLRQVVDPGAVFGRGPTGRDAAGGSPAAEHPELAADGADHRWTSCLGQLATGPHLVQAVVFQVAQGVFEPAPTEVQSVVVGQDAHVRGGHRDGFQVRRV